MPVELNQVGGWQLVRQIARPDMRWDLWEARREGTTAVLTYLVHQEVKPRVRDVVHAHVARAREVRAPGLAALLDYGVEPNPWFSEELAPDALRLEQRFAAGPLDLAETLEIATQTAAALAALHHAGVAKQALAPFDVVLVPTPQAPPLVILARAATGGLCAHAVKYSPKEPFDLAYAPPERMDHDQPETGTAGDVYALGAILFHCLVGRPPWQRNYGKDLRARAGQRAFFKPFAPAALHPLVTAMLDGRPAERPGIDEVIQTLLAVRP